MHTLETRQTPGVELFCDARGQPAHLAAVLYIDGNIVFADWAPPQSLMTLFQSRKDNQIMGLELLAIALGLSTFGELLLGRNVRVWSDNTGSEHATRRGASKQFDHNCIAHCIWLVAARLKIGMQIERVATDDNIADLPSREDYRAMQALGATRFFPKLDDIFWSPCSWESLRL